MLPRAISSALPELPGNARATEVGKCRQVAGVKDDILALRRGWRHSVSFQIQRRLLVESKERCGAQID